MEFSFNRIEQSFLSPLVLYLQKLCLKYCRTTFVNKTNVFGLTFTFSLDFLGLNFELKSIEMELKRENIQVNFDIEELEYFHRVFGFHRSFPKFF